MHPAQVQLICEEAMLFKRRGEVAEAVRILSEGLAVCYSEDSAPACYAPLWKSLAKLCYIQQDFPRAQDLCCLAITVYAMYGDRKQVDTCLMHLGACNDAFVRSKYYQPYLQAVATGKYAGVSFIGKFRLWQYAMKLGKSMYNEQRANEAALACNAWMRR